jgi:ADP-ribose pyrophosphatase
MSDRSKPGRILRPLASENQDAPRSPFIVWLWNQARRVVIFVTGMTVLLLGILMIIAPGPAVVVIPCGLAILATEFVWARKWLAYARRQLDLLAAASRLRNQQPPSPKKSRTSAARDYPPRQHVDESEADWKRPLVGYKPQSFTAPRVLNNPSDAVDPADVRSVTRPFLTYRPEGEVAPLIDADGYPLNPIGRTGLRGRGVLWKWGRNVAGDALVTRVDPDTGHLQVLVIQRNDTGETALPGGMMDEGESFATTVARELSEETGLELNFADAAVIYQGVVDDPRNTDNAWMETTVLHKHLSARENASTALKAGEDARAVHWMDVTDENLATMYASHGDYVREMKRRLG